MLSWHPADWAAVTGVAAVVIALAALLVSISQVVLTRRHSRLSVRPLLRLDCLPNETPRIVLVNTGVGPAIIKRFEVLAPVKAGALTAPVPFATALKSIGLQHRCMVYTPHVGDAISPAERLVLLQLAPEPGDDIDIAELSEQLSRLVIRVRYASVYSETYVVQAGWDLEAVHSTQ